MTDPDAPLSALTMTEEEYRKNYRIAAAGKLPKYVPPVAATPPADPAESDNTGNLPSSTSSTAIAPEPKKLAGEIPSALTMTAEQWKLARRAAVEGRLVPVGAVRPV